MRAGSAERSLLDSAYIIRGSEIHIAADPPNKKGLDQVNDRGPGRSQLWKSVTTGSGLLLMC